MPTRADSASVWKATWLAPAVQNLGSVQLRRSGVTVSWPREHAGHRRPDLVAHHREEFRLGPRGILRCLGRLAQLGRELFSLFQHRRERQGREQDDPDVKLQVLNPGHDIRAGEGGDRPMAGKRAPDRDQDQRGRRRGGAEQPASERREQQEGKGKEQSRQSVMEIEIADDRDKS